MQTLARWCFRNRFTVVIAWIVALIAVNAIHGSVGSNYHNDFKLPHTESFDAVRLLQKNAPSIAGDTERIVFGVSSGRVTDPAARARVDALLARLKGFQNVSQVVSPYEPGHRKQIAPSGQVAFATVTFDVYANSLSSKTSKAFVSEVTKASGNGVDFEVGGQVAEEGRRNNGSSGVGIGFLAAAVVLFAIFGTFAAMMLPLLTAGLSIGTGIAVVGLLSNVINMADFADQLALLIGLGVGVDYALFIVTRYRQAVMRGHTPEDAVAEALDTSGRAVLFAGIVVCIAMLGMFALGLSFFYGVAIAAALTVAFTVLAALTLLPALIRIFGKYILRRKDRRALAEHRSITTSDESPVWSRWTDVMARRPAVFAVGAILVMVAIAIPFFSMRLGSADQGSDPASSTTRKAYDLLAKGFGPGYNGPLQLVATVHNRAEGVAFANVLVTTERTPGIVGAEPPKFIPARDRRSAVVVANLYPKWSPQDAATTDLVDHLRASVIPAATRGTGLHVLVGGQTAIFEDFATLLTSKLPLFIAVVVLLSFLLLMAVFRSIVIPLTAALMNVLSTGAALGVVTAVFQFGWGSSLLGIDKTGPIEAFLPVIMFPILFGLSMDYEVFLVSRVYEEWHRRGSNREAVAHGLAATGRTITAAAAIMVLVFAAFVLGGERVIELFGISLASAVLLDAVIVRSVIVPAVMLLLGDLNWKLPAFLDRIIPHLKVEGESRPLHADAAASPSEPERVPV